MNKQFFITLLGTMSFLVGCNNNSQPQMSATQLNETAQIISKLTDSIRKLIDERDEALNFSLETNELSQQYFEDLNIKEKNPYIKSESNGRFLINKIRILNEKWVICEFSDGELWGDLLLEYHIDGNQKPTFKTLDEVIHPK